MGLPRQPGGAGPACTQLARHRMCIMCINSTPLRSTQAEHQCMVIKYTVQLGASSSHL